MKYMTIEDLYRLAKNNRACDDGLYYLKTWMKKHPKAIYVDKFFNDHKHIKKSHTLLLEKYKPSLYQYLSLSSKGVIESYFRWIALALINWGNFNNCREWLFKYYNTLGIGRDTPHDTIILLLISSFDEEGEEGEE